ncbi:MAG TPA: hypothetical protein DCP53_02095, partial [Elusimicrobia bacterium]|nr:hypothetical protein [Elusimicrobiota bacterium]
AIDNSDNIWICTYSSGVFKFDGTNWTNYTTSDGLAENQVLSISIDNEDNKWFGTGSGAISKFDDTNWTTYTYPNYYNLYFENTMAIDAQDNKWFGTYNRGVYKYNNTTWTNYTIENGLVNNNVKSIAFDSYGNKWFGTSNGISKYDGTTWTNYTSTDNMKLDVKAIAFDSYGNKWFGTLGGVSKFDDINWTYYTTFQGLSFGINSIKTLAVDSSNNIWINYVHSTTSIKFKNDTYTLYNYPSGINVIVIDNEGNKWFGTSNGIFKYDGITWTTYTTIDGLANNDIRAIAFDRYGNKWFGTWGGGVSKFDGTNWTTYTSTHGLVSNYVLSIAIDGQDNKWFGTGGGVSKFSGDKYSNYYIKGNIKNSAGLAMNGVTVNLTGDIVNSVVTSDNGNYEFLNLSTGIYRVSPGKTNYSFSPTYISTTSLSKNTTDWDFVGTIISTTNSVSPANAVTITISPVSGEIKVEISENTFADNTLITISTFTSPISNIEKIKVTNICIEINTDKGQQPTKEITITICYRQGDIEGYDENKLCIGRYEDSIGKWVALPSTIDRDYKKVTAKTKHLSKFALIQLVPAVDLKNTTVYPNPYKPEDARYGDTSLGMGIVFSGLTANAKIKIFNIAGELINELEETNGNGNCLWDTKNKEGNKVASGVYLYYIINPEDNSQKSKGKFAIIR